MLLTTVLGFLKQHYKLVALFGLGALVSFFFCYLFLYHPNAGDGTTITPKQYKAAVKHADEMKREIAAHKLVDDSLRREWAQDTIGHHQHELAVIALKDKVATQSADIKKLKTKYEKIDALDNATDDELFRHLSGIKIDDDGTRSNPR